MPDLRSVLSAAPRRGARDRLPRVRRPAPPASASFRPPRRPTTSTRTSSRSSKPPASAATARPGRRAASASTRAPGSSRAARRTRRSSSRGTATRARSIRLVAGLVEDIPMPPKKEGVTLTARQIGLLRAWIDAGAKYPAGVTLVNTNASAETAEAAEAEKIAAGRAREGQESLGLQGARPPAAAAREEHRLGEDADRCLRARAPREGGPRARARGRQGHAAAPRLAGPHGPAADVAGARRVPRRQGA